MARKKVELVYIRNDSARKTTFKKRKRGLVKKAHELSTLCGIDACAIVYNPGDSNLEVWPNNLAAQRVMAKFRNLPSMEQTKNMLDQESYTRQRVAKAEEQLRRKKTENQHKELSLVLYECLSGGSAGRLQRMNLAELSELRGLIDESLKGINWRIQRLQKAMAKVEEEVMKDLKFTADSPVPFGDPPADGNGNCFVYP